MSFLNGLNQQTRNEIASMGWKRKPATHISRRDQRIKEEAQEAAEKADKINKVRGNIRIELLNLLMVK